MNFFSNFIIFLSFAYFNFSGLVYSSIVCTNQFSQLPLRVQLYASTKSSDTSHLYSINELSQRCVHNTINNVTFHQELFYSKLFNIQETLLSGSLVQKEHLNVFILDFRLINSNVIFIDFFDYEKILSTTSTPYTVNSNIVLNLVSNQFISFRLLNVPEQSRNTYFKKLIIILNGKSKLDYFTTNSDPGFLSILHAPTYDDSKQITNIQSVNSRQKWLVYLQQVFYPNHDSNIHNSIVYQEHLHVFCHIYHVEVDLYHLFKVHLNPNLSTSDVNVFSYLKKKQTLEESRLHACTVQSSISLSKAPLQFENSKECTDKVYKQNRIFGKTNAQNAKNVYLIEIEQDKSVNEHLRFYFKNCEKEKEYYVILYFNANNQAQLGSRSRKIVFEHSICKFNSLSNVEIHNTFGQVLPDLKTFNIDSKDSCFGSISYKNMTVDQKLFYLMKHIEKTLEFSVENFYKIKLEVDTKEIELEFSNYAESSVNPQKFINHLNLQIFDVNDDENEHRNNRINRSIKLTVLENEIKAYFNYINVNYTDFHVNFANHNTKNSIFVTDNRCLFNQLTYTYDKRSSIVAYIFNINLFNNDEFQSVCHYLDRRSQTFYMTVGLYTESVKNFTHRTVFTLHHSYIKVKNELTNNYQVANYKEIKEWAKTDYFNAVIVQTLNAPYNLDSKVFKRIQDNYYEVTLDIKLTAMDDMIWWEVNSCWLSKEICSLNMEFLDEEYLTTLDDRTTNHDLTTSPWIENITEVIEYYYDYEYEDEDYDNNLLKFQEPVRKRKRRSFSDPDMGQVKKLNITKMKSLIRSRLTKNRNYELNLQAAFKISDFDSIEFNKNQFIMCDLKPVAACWSNECNSRSKIVKYFEDESNRNKNYRKKLLISDISRGIVSPLNLIGILPDFKCNTKAVSSNWYERLNKFHKSLKMDKMSYLFLLMNIACFFLIIFLINYLFCNKFRLNSKDKVTHVEHDMDRHYNNDLPFQLNVYSPTETDICPDQGLLKDDPDDKPALSTDFV